MRHSFCRFRRRRWPSLVVACLLAVALAPLARGQMAGLSDQQIKAAFLVNFVRYVDWPERSFAAADAPMTVCVLGDTTPLAGIVGKIVRGHPLQVRAVAGADEARSCHTLFVPDQDARRYVATLRGLQQLAAVETHAGDSRTRVHTSGGRLIDPDARPPYAPPT